MNNVLLLLNLFKVSNIKNLYNNLILFNDYILYYKIKLNCFKKLKKLISSIYFLHFIH